jgi:hypothetical protein
MSSIYTSVCACLNKAFFWFYVTTVLFLLNISILKDILNFLILIKLNIIS